MKVGQNLIPIMTKNVSGLGTAFSSRWDNVDGNAPYRAFNRNSEDGYVPNNSVPNGGGGDVGFSFLEPTLVEAYSVQTRTQGNSPKRWRFEASNDGINWVVIDTEVNQNLDDKKIKYYFTTNTSKFQKYRLYITESSSGTYVTVGELGMYRIVKEFVLIHVSNVYIALKEGKWVNITSSIPTEADFMVGNTSDELSTIPESAWAELQGEVEICYYTDDPDVSEVQFNIETEPFTLEDEFGEQQIKIIEYTDNPTQTESTITLDTEPFTIYDELGDSVDVLNYTDDPNVNSANLELIVNYSPLDEIEGDFEVVTWTNNEDNIDLNTTMKALPFEQLLIDPDDFNIYGTFQNILVNKISATGTIQLLLSFDDGTTWKSFRYGKWTAVDVANLDTVKKYAMSLYDLAKLTDKDLLSHVVKVAYYIDESNHGIDDLLVDNIKITSLAPINDVKFANAAFYVLNTVATINIKVGGNKLMGQLSDADSGKVQYRVFLNDKPYYPQNGAFSNLAPSPFNINLNISERDIVFGVENSLKVEFQDAWGQTDFWETKFIGTYSGLMFMDENKQYYSDTFGGILKYLDFDIIVAGQTTIDQKVIVKNQLGQQVQNLLLEVQKDKLPSGVKIELSYTSSPFLAEDYLLFNKLIDPDEELVFYVRIATDISAQPDPNGQFEIRAKVDTV